MSGLVLIARTISTICRSASENLFDERERIDVLDAEIGEQRLGVGLHAAAVDKAEPAARLARDQQILCDRHPRHLGQFLEHRAHAEPVGILRAAQVDPLALDADCARVGPQPSAQRLDQRALASAVLADERVHFGGRGRQRGVVERSHAAERLVQPGAYDHGHIRGGELLRCHHLT